MRYGEYSGHHYLVSFLFVVVRKIEGVELIEKIGSPSPLDMEHSEDAQAAFSASQESSTKALQVCLELDHHVSSRSP